MTKNEARKILGITENKLTLDDLKKLFKKQMLQWHPDIAVHKGISYHEATAKSQQIISAYETLAQDLDTLPNASIKHRYDRCYQRKTSRQKTYEKSYDYEADDLDIKFVNRITLNSSSVKWIDYISDLQILVVRFKRSLKYYLYYDVPRRVFEEFRAAESPGKFVRLYLQEYRYESHENYLDWLNVYKTLNDILDENDSGNHNTTP